MKKVNKPANVKSAKVKIAEAKVRIAQRKLAEAKKALKEAETKTINGYTIAELGKGRFIDLSESVITLDDNGVYAVQLPAESKYAGKYLVYGIYADKAEDEDEDEDEELDEDEDDDEYDLDGPWTAGAYIFDSIPEKIDIDDFKWGFVHGDELDEDDGEGQQPIEFIIDADTNEYFVSDQMRDDTIGLYFGKDAHRFIWNVNFVNFGIKPKLDDED